MSIEQRVTKGEEALSIGSSLRPRVIVLSAKQERTPAEQEAWEARTRARVERAIRHRPGQPFILLC